MSRRATGSLLPVVFGVLVYFHPVSAQQPPPGYQLLTAPQTSGGLLFTQRQAVPSAVQFLRQGFQEIAPFFDHRPEALGGYAETRDQYAEAGFRTTSRQLLITGVAFAVIGNGAGTLGFAFDTPATLPQSLPRLLQLVGTPEGGAATGCAPPAQRWQVVPFPDGSGQIELPEGWRITGASRGTVSAEGPHGIIGRAAQSMVMTRAAASRMRGASLPVADPTDPVTPFMAVGAYWNALRQKEGLPTIRVTRVLQVNPVVPPASGFIHDAFLEVEADFRERPYRGFSHVLVGAVMDGLYLYYESGGGAPAECFAAHLPTLMRILGSAHTASHVINEILQRARRSQQEAHDIWWDATRNQERARDRMHDNWTEAFRGTRVVEDTRTGTRRDVNLGYSTEIVQRLNQQEGYERYREIPLRDLNQ